MAAAWLRTSGRDQGDGQKRRVGGGGNVMFPGGTRGHAVKGQHNQHRDALSSPSHHSDSPHWEGDAEEEQEEEEEEEGISVLSCHPSSPAILEGKVSLRCH